MKTHSIAIENLKCGGCVNSIQTALLKIKGVEDVAVSQEDEIVTLKGNVERSKIIEKLSALGYPEKGNNSMMHKAKSMVSCVVGKIS